MKSFKEWFKENYDGDFSEVPDEDVDFIMSQYEEYCGRFEDFDWGSVTLDDLEIVRKSKNADGSDGEWYISAPGNPFEIYRNGNLVDYKQVDYDTMNYLDKLIDLFQEGGNELEEVGGELFECLELGVWKLMREARRI